MSGLDKKLEDICYRMYENSGNSIYIRAEWANKPFHPDDALKEIKQAFIDEGWIPPTASAGFRDRYNIMRGQEWYDRFVKELDIMNSPHPKATNQDLKPLVDWQTAAVIHTAKKASGIE